MQSRVVSDQHREAAKTDRSKQPFGSTSPSVKQSCAMPIYLASKPANPSIDREQSRHERHKRQAAPMRIVRAGHIVMFAKVGMATGASTRVSSLGMSLSDDGKAYGRVMPA